MIKVCVQALLSILGYCRETLQNKNVKTSLLCNIINMCAYMDLRVSFTLSHMLPTMSEIQKEELGL